MPATPEPLAARTLIRGAPTLAEAAIAESLVALPDGRTSPTASRRPFASPTTTRRWRS